MMVKVVSFILFTGMLFFNNNQSFAREHPEYVRISNEVRKNFIQEMEKKYGWVCIGTGGSMPYDIEDLDVMFNVYQKGSIELARKLIISSTERFREIIYASEKLRPYLRNIPLDITAAHVMLNFKDKHHKVYLDESVVHVMIDYKGDIVYDGAKKNQSSSWDYFEIHRESYDEALKILGIQAPLHISLVNKGKEASSKERKETDLETKQKIAQTLSEKEEALFVQYGPGDELKMLELSGTSGFCSNVVEAIRERVAGIADKYFDEEFFQRIAAKVKGSPNSEYTEYWPNGELRVKVQWKNGKPDGHMHGWYPNAAEAFKAYFKEGIKQGVHMTFFPLDYTIVPSSIARLYYYNEAGQLDGRQETSYSNIRSKAIVYYRNGILDGAVLLCKARREDPPREWAYKNGKLITKK